MKKSFLAVSVATLCTPLFSLAADAHQIDETMVVTANRFEQPESSVLAPFNVVTKQEIEDIQAKTLTEVLNLLPGVQITQNGGRGQLSNIFVRGANSDQVLVLVDGIRMARSVAGSVDFNQIPLTQVERIEFTRGARAALYGSEAIGGVINIITMTGSDSPSKTKLNLGIGSHDYQEANISGGYKVGNNGLLQIAVGYEDEEGYNVKPQPGLNDGDKHGFDTRNAMLAYHHRFSDNLTGFVSTRWYKNHYQYDSLGAYTQAQTELYDYAAGMNYTQDRYQSSVLVDYQKQDNIDHDDLSGTIQRKDQYHQKTIQWHNQYQLAAALALSGGIDWRQEQWQDFSGLAGDKQRSNMAYYGIALWETNPLSLQASLRLDDNQQFGAHSTYNIAGGWYVTDHIQLRTSYGTAFKAPNLYQLYVKSQWGTAGNPDLKPETSENIDVAVHFDYDIASVAVTAYQMHIDELINYTGGNPSYENVEGESKIKGIEVEANFDTAFINHQLNFDFKDPKDSYGKQLSRREKFSFKWVGSASFGDLDAAVTYQYHGKRPDAKWDSNLGSSVPVELSAYDTWDIALTYWLQPKLALKGRVSNLFDEDYQTAYGYELPGRVFYTSINYQF
ncbi:TPA: TonB-dependent vitamin B12 receptor [Photobacterium damselae]